MVHDPVCGMEIKETILQRQILLLLLNTLQNSVWAKSWKVCQKKWW